MASARRLHALRNDQLAETGLPAPAMALCGFPLCAGMCDEAEPAPLPGVVAIAGRMQRKDARPAEGCGKPPFLILKGEKDNPTPSAASSPT